MGNLNCLYIITRREFCEEYLSFLHGRGVRALSAAPCEGTAQQKTLDLLGIEKTEKVLLTSVIPSEECAALLRGLIRTMQIDLPGNGIAFTVPLQSAANTPAMAEILAKSKPNEVTNMEETKYALVVAVVRKGAVGAVMEAARSAGAGGGTILHAKGQSSHGEAQFFGMSIAEEQELLQIVTTRSDERAILRAVMEREKERPGTVEMAYSLPVSEVVGLRSLTEPSE